MGRTEFWLLIIIAALALYIPYFHLNASITRVKNKNRSSRTRISNGFDFHDLRQVTLDNSCTIGMMWVGDTREGLRNDPGPMDREPATASVSICAPVHSGCLQYVDKEVGRSPNGRVMVVPSTIVGLTRENEDMD